MAVNYSVPVRLAMLDAIETATGANAKLIFYTGSKPTKCSDAATGSVVATLDLTGNSGDWMSAATEESTNVVTKSKHPSSTWSASATLAGNNVVGYYRIYDSTGTTCHEQGTVTAVGGGGDITLDNTTVAQNQTITVVSKKITSGNA